MLVKIQIYIVDTSVREKYLKLQEENETLGFEKNKIDSRDLDERWQLIDFLFDSNALYGFWVDPEKHDDTKTRDIIIYIGSTSFRTPYSQEKENILCNIINDRRR